MHLAAAKVKGPTVMRLTADVLEHNEEAKVAVGLDRLFSGLRETAVTYIPTRALSESVRYCGKPCS